MNFEFFSHLRAEKFSENFSSRNSCACQRRLFVHVISKRHVSLKTRQNKWKSQEMSEELATQQETFALENFTKQAPKSE